MKKYEIYLPLKYNDGREIEAEKIKQIREELIAVFGALTVSSQSAPYQGIWKYGGVDFIEGVGAAVPLKWLWTSSLWRNVYLTIAKPFGAAVLRATGG